MTEMAHVLVAGASRGVGREVVKCLREQNQTVTALLRSETARTELEAMGVAIALADALDVAAVEAALLELPSIDALVSTIGGLPSDGERADYKGNKHLIDAAVKAGVKHFILVSSIGAGKSVEALPPHVLEALGAVLKEKELAEDYLMASGLPYTIIRPGGLLSEPSGGEAVLTEDYRVAGSIRRADVATLVCQCLTSERAKNRVFSAVDRSKLYGDPAFEVFSFT